MTTKANRPSSRQMISLEQAAEIIGCHPRTIRRRIAEGQLTGYRMGLRILRVDQAEVENLLRPIPTGGVLF
jgi:excisionase family DNA binding protein